VIKAQLLNRDWESVFGTWAAAPSATEQAKSENAERAIRKAIDASEKLSAKDIGVLAQGSYANRTNVRQDSDVDICILCKNTFFPNYAMSEGLNDAVFGFTNADYKYADFKNDVETALKSYFGAGSITRGSKAFDVHENTYRLDADVVPCFEHVRFMGSPQSNWRISGTQFLPDSGGIVINWPRQTTKTASTRTTRPDADSKLSSAFSNACATRWRPTASRPPNPSPPTSSSAWSGTFPRRDSDMTDTGPTCATRLRISGIKPVQTAHARNGEKSTSSNTSFVRASPGAGSRSTAFSTPPGITSGSNR